MQISEGNLQRHPDGKIDKCIAEMAEFLPGKIQVNFRRNTSSQNRESAKKSDDKAQKRGKK
jgi:hypothetical protein